MKGVKLVIMNIVLLLHNHMTALMDWLLDILFLKRRGFPYLREQACLDTPLWYSDSHRMLSLESLKAVWHGNKLDYLKEAQLGQEAPNTAVVRLQDQQRTCILDYALGNRLLILNFGSCSSILFMLRLNNFERVMQQNADIARSVVVYIEETHASDGWVSPDAPYQIPQHRHLQDRLNAAALMRRAVSNSMVVVDNMENTSSAAYGAYFERLYIIHRGRIVYQGGRGPDEYSIYEVKVWLDQHRKRVR